MSGEAKCRPSGLATGAGSGYTTAVARHTGSEGSAARRLTLGVGFAGLALALATGVACSRDQAPAGSGASTATEATPAAAVSAGFEPGQRVLLDAHNAYPYEGRFADRIDRGLATGLPVAIEQDLIWRPRPDGGGDSVVAHDLEHAGDAPTFERYFFERVRPLVEQALAEDDRASWPVLVLNLDFKTTEPEHLEAVWQTLGTYEAWLTTAPRTGTPDRPEPLTVGPLLVLTGTSADQAARFHDAVPVGATLRLFGAIEVPAPPGDDAAARAAALATMPPDTLIVRRTGNYRRWVNFPWAVVEAGGPPRAGDWTDADEQRLRALVQRAHDEGLWIRFYTLNGHGEADNQGWFAGYNFGSLERAAVRWRAAREAGVDFIATDQYEAFAAAR